MLAGAFAGDEVPLVVGAGAEVADGAVGPARDGEGRLAGAERVVVLPALELWLPATELLLLLRVEPTSRLKREFMEDIGKSRSWAAASLTPLPEGAAPNATATDQCGRGGAESGRRVSRQAGRQARGRRYWLVCL